jgi:aryl-alcohol dehydrogenase-like predicted oxidoreductase
MTPATLGASGVGASRLGVGLAAVGRPGYITLGRAADLPDRSPDALAARTTALLDAAWAAGVRYVDVARSYGRGEEFLARWLRARDLGAGTVTVGSKWGYRYTAGWRVDAPVHEEKELSVERFRAQLAESRALLGDRLALYQIHSATPEAVADARLLGALVAGRRSRAYRAVGLTLSGPDSARTLELALAARVDGGRVFDVVQATFNCLEPSLAGPLAAAHAAGVGVIVKEALANGRLTDANTRPEDEHLVRTLRAAATRRGDDVSRFALAFVLEQPWVDVVLSGAATTAQLASNVAALDVALDDVGRAILASVAEPPSRYWATRASLPWT